MSKQMQQDKKPANAASGVRTSGTTTESVPVSEKVRQKVEQILRDRGFTQYQK